MTFDLENIKWTLMSVTVADRAKWSKIGDDWS